MKGCKTCSSPYVEEIDQMILADWDVTEIVRLLKGKYPHEILPSYDSILRHKNLHVQEYINRGVKGSKARQSKIDDEIKSSILAAQQLRKNLQMTSEGLKQLWEQWLATQDYSKLKEVANLITAANKSIELLLRFSAEIAESKMTQTEVFNRLMWCIDDLPIDMIQKVKERWEKYES